MRKLLNTVYVTTEGAALRKDGENLVADVDGETKARVPLHMLASVVAFGPILVSPALVVTCSPPVPRSLREPLGLIAGLCRRR